MKSPPDDEAYLSAGIMGALRDAGHRVVVATATYGELGTPDPDRCPPDRLAAVRRDELSTSLALVGVREHRWLGFADGTCAEVPAATGSGPVTPDRELAVYVELAGTALDRKIAAVRAHVSQTTDLVSAVGADTFRRWWSAEAFVAAEPVMAGVR